MDAKLITRAICSGFITVPKECQESTKPRDPTQPFIREVKGVSFKQLMGWFTALSFIICALMMFYKRYLQKEMRSNLREEVMLEVQAAMGEYTKMRGNG